MKKNVWGEKETKLPTSKKGRQRETYGGRNAKKRVKKIGKGGGERKLNGKKGTPLEQEGGRGCCTADGGCAGTKRGKKNRSEQ